MKKKGFTLSELLVVVVIIGVLSAVVLPKFSKVIETRKTTEAEELMSAVRTEQEARCTLSKSYTASKDSLGSYKDGKYFNYDLGTVGMTARATSGKYKLEMPSYADGRICCSEVTEGSKECEKLNKNYPLCKDLIHNTDYVAGNENCEVELEDGKETPTEPEEPTPACPTTHENVSTYTDSEGCMVTTSWELKEYPACWVSSTSKSNCPEPKCTLKDYKELCPQDSKHYVYYTVNKQCEYERDASACEGCSKDPKDCPSGYWNKNCICIECLESRHVKVNATRTACEPTMSLQDCIAQGGVYEDLSAEHHLFDGHYGGLGNKPLVACWECSRYGIGQGKPTGKSSDGTVAGCERDNTVCPIDQEYCAKQGLILYPNGLTGDHLVSDCLCVSCEWYGRSGYSTDGTKLTCTEGHCGVTQAECAAQGLVFRYNSSNNSCKCVTCASLGFSGSSLDGTTKGCNDCKY